MQVRRASARFSQLGQPEGGAPRLVLTAALGTSWGGNSLGASYTRQRGGPFDSNLAQVNYSRDLGYWGYVGVVAFKDIASGANTLALSWSRALDSRHSAGMSVQRQAGSGADSTLFQAQVQRNPSFGSGLGYQLTTESGGRQMAQAQLQGEYAVLTGGVARRGSDVETRAGAAGGFTWVDGSFFAGRRIEGGIAVVDVGGHEGVRVLQDNQIVARTDARGRAFVTGLRGYQPQPRGHRCGRPADGRGTAGAGDPAHARRPKRGAHRLPRAARPLRQPAPGGRAGPAGDARRPAGDRRRGAPLPRGPGRPGPTWPGWPRA